MWYFFLEHALKAAPNITPLSFGTIQLERVCFRRVRQGLRRVMVQLHSSHCGTQTYGHRRVYRAAHARRTSRAAPVGILHGVVETVTGNNPVEAIRTLYRDPC